MKRKSAIGKLVPFIVWIDHRRGRNKQTSMYMTIVLYVGLCIILGTLLVVPGAQF